MCPSNEYREGCLNKLSTWEKQEGICVPCEKCSESELRVGCGVDSTQGGLKAIDNGRCVQCIDLCLPGTYSAQCVVNSKGRAEAVPYLLKKRGEGKTTLDSKADCTPCTSGKDSTCGPNEFTNFARRDDSNPAAVQSLFLAPQPPAHVTESLHHNRRRRARGPRQATPRILKIG